MYMNTKIKILLGVDPPNKGKMDAIGRCKEHF